MQIRLALCLLVASAGIARADHKFTFVSDSKHGAVKVVVKGPPSPWKVTKASQRDTTEDSARLFADTGVVTIAVHHCAPGAGTEDNPKAQCDVAWKGIGVDRVACNLPNPDNTPDPNADQEGLTKAEPRGNDRLWATCSHMYKPSPKTLPKGASREEIRGYHGGIVIYDAQTKYIVTCGTELENLVSLERLKQIEQVCGGISIAK